MAVTEDERRIGCAASHERVDDRPSGALDDLGIRSSPLEERDQPVRCSANVARVAAGRR